MQLYLKMNDEVPEAMDYIIFVCSYTWRWMMRFLKLWTISSDEELLSTVTSKYTTFILIFLCGIKRAVSRDFWTMVFPGVDYCNILVLPTWGCFQSWVHRNKLYDINWQSKPVLWLRTWALLKPRKWNYEYIPIFETLCEDLHKVLT